jgi:hypothetical protein
MAIQAGVLKRRILATLLADSQKYATYNNTASFSQFQEKKISGLQKTNCERQ